MADNFDFTQGAGKTARAREKSAVVRSAVELDIGGSGAEKIIAAAGDGATAAADAFPVTQATEDRARIGIVTEAAPASDTASSGLNGRLQRIAQRLTTMLTGLVVAAGENHVGEVGGAANLISVTCTLDTSAYASGELLADTQEIANALRVSGGTAILHSIMLLDESDQGVPMDVYILDANQSLGSENSAPSISDANAAAILGAPISIASADWRDLGGCRIAGRDGIAKVVKGNGSSSLWFAIVNGTGAPTFGASAIKIRFGFLQN